MAMSKDKSKGIVPAQNLRKSGIRLPNTPPVITTIGGAYGHDITHDPKGAAQYGIQTSKTGGTKSGKSSRKA